MGRRYKKTADYFRDWLRGLTHDQQLFVANKLQDWGFMEIIDPAEVPEEERAEGYNYYRLRRGITGDSRLSDVMEVFEELSLCVLYYLYGDRVDEIDVGRPPKTDDPLEDMTSYAAMYLALANHTRAGVFRYITDMIDHGEHQSSQHDLRKWQKLYRQKFCNV